MTPERWQQVEELFHSALSREPGQWATFLAQACAGDESLLREVESLISFHDDPASFIEMPASDLAAELFAKRPSELEPGQQVAHYKVLSSLGAGGMGEVYLAEDTRLGRRIALKLLPAQFTTDAERVRRFEQEARAASALNHPNIVTIHDIGRAGSSHFIATEFIDGETLREHSAGRAVKLNEALDIATQVASALEAAHAAGIVHRDIKPENVMLRRDRIVKVLDFGLAKLALPQLSAIDPEAQTRSVVITNPGVLMGTVQYMSPEQARGWEVDSRTDIWSLGVMLYEMVTGRAPFEGETPSHVIVSILESEPSQLACYSELPVELERIIGKALRKDREERYQTASELSVDLKSLKQDLEADARLNRSLQPNTDTGSITKGDSEAVVETVYESVATTGDVATARRTSSAEYLVGEIKRHRRIAVFAAAAVFVAVAAIAYFFYPTGGGEAIDSIAVLPFVNVTGDPNTEYLSVGISDSVINSLSRLPRLGVISLNRVLRYKGKHMDPQTIGRELNVKAVLMGTLTQHGDRLSISAELVDVRDNRRLWGEQYNRNLSEILIVKDDIARQISTGLRLRLSGEEKKQLAKHDTDDPEAYRLYNLGNYFSRQGTKEAREKAIEYFEQAIKQDPNYALAFVAKARCYNSLGTYGFWPTKESEQAVELATLKALEIDEMLPDAHAYLGMHKYNNFDWSGAEKELKRALDLDPNSAIANAMYFQYLSTVGRADEALSYQIRASELDPIAEPPGHVAYACFLARQYDMAIDLWIKEQKKADRPSGNPRLAEAYLANGMYEEGIAEMQRFVAEDTAPEPWNGQPLLAYAYAVVGRRDEALKILGEQTRFSRKDYISPYNFAIIYTGLGDKDKAFEWLEKGVEQRTRLVSRLKSRPMFDPLRSDPRYAELLRAMNLEP